MLVTKLLTVATDFHCFIFFHTTEVNGYRQLFSYSHSLKYILCPARTAARNSYWFGTSEGWWQNLHFGWTLSLTIFWLSLHCESIVSWGDIVYRIESWHECIVTLLTTLLNEQISPAPNSYHWLNHSVYTFLGNKPHFLLCIHITLK